MPISLPALNRRQFLGASAAGAAAFCLAGESLARDPQTDPNRFALLADTHIDGNRDTIARGVNMFQNLHKTCAEIQALPELPAAVLIGGDCAYLKGTSEDYANLMELIKPVRESGLPVHMAMGNHDNRERFWAAAGAADRDARLPERHALMLDAPHANLFLLDSLDVTNKTPGVLGETQLQWLTGALDAAADKPAIVMLHHNPDSRPEPSGLTDTAALFAAILPRRNVKALVFGHSHNWSLGVQDGLHLINLPPVAYVFGADKPNGWVNARLTANSMKLELRTLDATHPLHGQQTDLAWRT